MSEPVAITDFLTRWSRSVGHDLSGSDSETLTLSALLDLAEPEDLERWTSLGFSYSDPRGASRLRAAIARRYAQIGADDVLCCAGAQEAVASVTAALLGPDDHAIVVLPIYQPSERAVTRLCDATGVPLRQGCWQLDIDRVAAAIGPRTKLILSNFPNSPTGAGLASETLSELVALCRRHGLWLVNDEVYRQTDASGDRPTIPPVADAYERGISIDGLSKGFGLPGLRVGWAVSRDPTLLSRATGAKSLMSSCLSSASEVLAEIALRAERAITARTRAIGAANLLRLNGLVRRFPDVFEVGGGRNLAFAFPRYLGPDGVDLFAERLVRQAGLLVLPSTLWRSPLGPISNDHLRIGLGHAQSSVGLDALERHISSRDVRSASSG